MKATTLSILLTLIGFAVTLADSKFDYMTDSRDGRTYKTVTIGSQTWMAENLNFEYVRSSLCYWDPNDPTEDECKTFGRYGRYYTWDAAMDSVGIYSRNGKGCGDNKRCSPTYPVRGICPEGWHLPDTAEWKTLYKAIGQKPFAMQAKGYENWKYATNASNFSALPGGDFVEGFNDFGEEAYFWSSTEHNQYLAYYWDLDANKASLNVAGGKNVARTVRCIKNVDTDSRKGKTYKTVKIGNQIWMAENLNIKKSGSDCFENLQKNCEQYGRRYTRNAAMHVCPNGWHLPSKADFVNAAKYYEGKLDGDNEFMWWNTGDFIPNLLNDVVMPKGFYFVNGSDPNVEDSQAVFWTTSDDNHQAYYMFPFKKGAVLAMMSRDYAKSKFSVRCIQD